MRSGSLAVALTVIFVFAWGCAPSVRPTPPVLPAVSGGEDRTISLRDVIAAAPNLAWRTSALDAKRKYLYFSGANFGPGFYLTDNGFRYLESENFALRYDKEPEGFMLVEVKKRQGVTHLPDCPVYIPSDRCVEDHDLMIATVVRCSDSCSYRFVVFDYYDPVFILRSDPTIISIMRKLVDGTPTRLNFEIKFEEDGKIPFGHAGWIDFIQARFGFMRNKIRTSEGEYDLEFLYPVSVSGPEAGSSG